jgi:hypothetical protein
MPTENDEATRSVNSIAPASIKSKRLSGEERPLDGLVSWLLDSGAVINSLTEKKIQSNLFPGVVLIIGSGRGLFTTRRVEEGETLIRIPENCLVNLSTLGDLHSKYPRSLFSPPRLIIV